MEATAPLFAGPAAAHGFPWLAVLAALVACAAAALLPIAAGQVGPSEPAAAVGPASARHVTLSATSLMLFGCSLAISGQLLRRPSEADGRP